VCNQDHCHANSSNGLPPFLIVNQALRIAEHIGISENQAGSLKVDSMFCQVPAVFRLISFKAHSGVVTEM